MKWLRRLFSTGIRPEMAYRERRKITIINFAGILGGCSSLVFLISNLYAGFGTLMLLNVITLLSGFSILYFHKRGFYTYPPIVTGFLYSICCATSALLYDNNMEFYLLIFIGVYFMLMDNFKVSIPFSILNTLLFLFIYHNPHLFPDFPSVSSTHRFVVLFNGMVLFLFFLYYFKKQNLSYQRRIEKQNRELNLLNLNKEKLFAIIAHDIRSPIASTGNALQMLKQDIFTPEEFAELSSKLADQVNNVQENIDTILLWSQSQLNGIDVKPRTIDLLPIISRVLAGAEIAMAAKSIKADLTGIIHTTATVDPNHLQLILRNLLSNAIKFSYEGSSIKIHAVREENTTQITVQDFGTGIAPENLKLIFADHSFYSSQGTRKEKGTGLGLKLCKEFAEKNHGKIWVESLPGSGSSFTLSLPG